MPVAEIDGVALILFTAYINILLGDFENGAWVKDGNWGKTNVDDESVEFAGVGYKAVGIALVGGVSHIGSYKFVPGRGVSKEGLVGDETVEFAVSGKNVEFGRKIGRDEAGRRGRGGNDLLGVVLKYISTDNRVRWGNDTIVVDNATYEFVKVGGKKVIGCSLVYNYVGGIYDKLGKSSSVVGNV